MSELWKQIEACHKAHPDWTGPEISRWLKANPGSVRMIAWRNGLKLDNGNATKLNKLRRALAAERERCAMVAERSGAKDAATEIRALH